MQRVPAATAALAALLLVAPARAQDPAPEPVEEAEEAEEPEEPDAEEPAKPAAAAEAEPPPSAAPAAAPPAAPQTTLRSAVEGFVGAAVHGELTTRYRARWTSHESDHDLEELLSLRVGDEWKDEWSANVFARATHDLDRDHGPERGRDRTFVDLTDSYDHRTNGKVYTAYLTFRPQDSKLVDSVRMGRQYVYTAETYHVDGVLAESAALDRELDLRVKLYGGVPVHLYESDHGGDWLAGAQVSARPFQKTRAALDYTHAEDHVPIFGENRNDLAALSVWQQVGTRLSLFGRLSWLEGWHDAEARATFHLPEEDLLVQASYLRLIEEMEQEFTTEYDPYYRALLTLERYQQGSLRISKGFGDHFAAEAGLMVRDVLGRAGPFNRDFERWYVTPSVEDLPWEGFSAALTLERWSADGTALHSWGAEVGYEVTKALRLSAGTDYSLYKLGFFAVDERNHVRTVWGRVRYDLTESLEADARFTWEQDDEEVFRVFTVGLTLSF